MRVRALMPDYLCTTTESSQYFDIQFNFLPSSSLAFTLFLFCSCSIPLRSSYAEVNNNNFFFFLFLPPFSYHNTFFISSIQFIFIFGLVATSFIVRQRKKIYLIRFGLKRTGSCYLFDLDVDSRVRKVVQCVWM